MTHTLYIGNDIVTAEPVQIFCEEDFVRMVDERLGRDASDYVNNIIEQRNDAIRNGPGGCAMVMGSVLKMEIK